MSGFRFVGRLILRLSAVSMSGSETILKSASSFEIKTRKLIQEICFQFEENYFDFNQFTQVTDISKKICVSVLSENLLHSKRVFTNGYPSRSGRLKVSGVALGRGSPLKIQLVN